MELSSDAQKELDERIDALGQVFSTLIDTQKEVLRHGNSFFERVLLLDGGIVTLTFSAAMAYRGKLETPLIATHARAFQHLRTGWLLLVASMLCCLLSNLTRTIAITFQIAGFVSTKGLIDMQRLKNAMSRFPDYSQDHLPATTELEAVDRKAAKSFSVYTKIHGFSGALAILFLLLSFGMLFRFADSVFQ